MSVDSDSDYVNLSDGKERSDTGNHVRCCGLFIHEGTYRRLETIGVALFPILFFGAIGSTLGWAAEHTGYGAFIGVCVGLLFESCLFVCAKYPPPCCPSQTIV